VPLNSVQLYVKGLLDGLELPSPMPPLKAYVAVPPVSSEATPIAFVWGSNAREARHTMPRAQPGQPATGGFKKIPYLLEVWIQHAESASGQNADSKFPSIVDAVTAVLRNTQMPVTITDPDTGQTSTILEIGEEIDVDYPPARAIQQQRIYDYRARLTLPIREEIQA
jgi:hypothetical protein